MIPATEGVSLKDERVKKQTYEMIYEVKLKETMGVVFQELVKAAAIENKLVGSVKLANEEQEADYNTRRQEHVKLMRNRGGGGDTRRTTRPSAPVPRGGRRRLEGQAAPAGRGLARGRPAVREAQKRPLKTEPGQRRGAPAVRRHAAAAA